MGKQYIDLRVSLNDTVKRITSTINVLDAVEPKVQAIINSIDYYEVYDAIVHGIGNVRGIEQRVAATPKGRWHKGNTFTKLGFVTFLANFRVKQSTNKNRFNIRITHAYDSERADEEANIIWSVMDRGFSKTYRVPKVSNKTAKNPLTFTRGDGSTYNWKRNGRLTVRKASFRGYHIEETVKLTMAELMDQKKAEIQRVINL